MNNKTMIPVSLFKRLINLLDGLDTSRYEYNSRCEYDDILWELKNKMQKLDLREAYSRIILAKNDDARRWARIEYLRQKKQYENSDSFLPF